MTPERNGVTIKLEPYPRACARTDAYRLGDFGYAFVSNLYMGGDEEDVDAIVVITNDVFEKRLISGFTLYIVPHHCITILRPWTDEMRANMGRQGDWNPEDESRC